MFDLQKEFTLCFYEDRLEEIKKDFFEVFGAFLNRPGTELLWSVRYLGIIQLFLPVWYKVEETLF